MPRSQFLNSMMLIAADILTFAIADLLFRMGRHVPGVVFFVATGSKGAPLDIFLVLAIFFVCVRFSFGDYTQRRLFWDRVRATTLTLFLFSVPCFVIVALTPDRALLLTEFGSWAFLIFAIPLNRQLLRIALDRLNLWRVPTALIASPGRYQDIYKTISNTLTLGFEISWLVLEPPPKDASVDCAVKVLEPGEPRELAARLAESGCTRAIIATDDMQSSVFGDLIQRLTEADIAVSFIPSFRRLPLVGVSVSYFFGKDMLLFQVRSSLQNLTSRLIKRLFDIVGSITALILLAPLFLVVGVVIKMHDGGPLVYKQVRVGMNGRKFSCLKFRTMAVNADERLKQWQKACPELYAEYQRTFKLIDDPRVTAPGVSLRKSSLDELPQLINVLRGDMSLVGPRPVVERELYDYYGTAAHLYKRVRPGLTGLWQVSGRSDTSYETRVIFDEWYILNWSFWYDLVILLQTVWVVLLRKGAY